MDWQPISLAPADEVVLVANPDEGRMPVIAWRVGSDWWQFGIYGQKLRPDPTIWCRWPTMPKPDTV